MPPDTLVISDLHIGARDRYSIAERPQVLERLVAAAGRCQRLVLLGDLVELLEAPAERTFTLAEPILHQLGRAVGPDGEIIFSPGNHDRALIARWIRAQGAELQREAVVPIDAGRALRQIVEELGVGGSRVEVRYPGVWLSDRVWAHHGHYLNHYLWPDQAYGLLWPGRRRLPAFGSAIPSDFEPSRAPHRRPAPGPPDEEPKIVPVARWHSRLHERVLHARVSPATAYLLGRQVRHHSLPAMRNVAAALGVDADYVIFGHIHRRGPLPGDRLSQWNAAGRGPLLLNTGSWRWEPVLVGQASAPHPYWPGGGVVIEADGIPRTIDLLDGIERALLS